MHPVFGAYFNRMCSDGLIDLESRPGKLPDIFCSELMDEAVARLFCNSVGNTQEVFDIVHESGHAFQCWESFGMDLVDLQTPTKEACEIPSVTMEFFTLNHLDIFFKPEQAANIYKSRLMEVVLYLPFICLVDEFQHEVYAHPEWSARQRGAAWSSLWDSYMAGLDYAGFEEFKAYHWQQKSHIFTDPFYYIDYALAEICALQLWLIYREDPERAMAMYLQLCRLGGSKSFLELLKTVGLESPFKPGLVKKLTRLVAQELP
jgi:M3 family oligoendopeptidase